MRILLTGANGYIGTRLLSLLVEKGHEIIALARYPKSVKIFEEHRHHISVIAADLLHPKTLSSIPNTIDVAYYLVHSMAKRYRDFDRIDKEAAKNFVNRINQTSCMQIIYLTGLIGNKKHLSKHLFSRFEVEQILNQAKAPLTALRAGIIIGSGSASFEIIRDLTEKLPIMVAPKSIKSKKCQPLAICDVLYYLMAVLNKKECLGQIFDIGGPDVLSYKEMLKGYAKKRKLFRWILSIPILTPKISSYWLVLITSTNYYLARTLIESVKNDAICHEHKIKTIFPHKCLSYQKALDKAFDTIESDRVLSTWENSWASSGHTSSTKHFQIPDHGCLSIKTTQTFDKSPDEVFRKILMIGGQTGWYFMNWAWKIRALINLALGGVGLRIKRRSQKHLRVGDVIDFWRVLLINVDKRHLILLAEMKLPGEAWLEFKIDSKENRWELKQKAIFRPRGISGRIYWYLCYPIHLILFPGMLYYLVKGKK